MGLASTHRMRPFSRPASDWKACASARRSLAPCCRSSQVPERARRCSSAAPRNGRQRPPTAQEEPALKPKTIRVLLVDDHETVREGLRLLVDAQADMQVVGEAGDGRDGLERVAALKPDVVVLDLTMPGMSG